MSVVCLIIITGITYVSSYNDSIGESYSLQRELVSKIANNQENAVAYYKNLEAQIDQAAYDELWKSAKLVGDSGDSENIALIDEYIEAFGADNLTIVDSDRRIIHTYGDFSETPELKKRDYYTDSYYDDLFSGATNVENKESDCVVMTEAKDYDLEVYCAKCKDEYLIFLQDKAVSFKDHNMEEYWSLVMGEMFVSKNAIITVLDSENRILYCDDKDITELTEMQLLDDYDGFTYYTAEANGVKYSVTATSCKDINDDDVRVAALFPYDVSLKEILISSRTKILFAFVAILTVMLFVIFLREDAIETKDEIRFLKKNFLRLQLRRVIPFSIMVALVLFVCLIVYINLGNLTDNENELKTEIKKSISLYEEYCSDIITIDDVTDTRYYNYGHLLNIYYTEHPEKLTKEGLKEMCKFLGVNSISVFDSRGNTVCTSSSLDKLNVLDDTESSLYDLRYTLTGKEELCIETDTSYMNEEGYIYAVNRTNEEGVTCGAIAIEPYSEVLMGMERLFTLENLDNYIRNLSKNGDFWIIGLDDEDLVRLYYDESYTGKEISTLGIEDEVLVDGYESTNTLADDTDVIVMVGLSDYGYVIDCLKFQWISKNSLKESLILTLIFIVLSAFFIYDGLGSKEHFEDVAIKAADIEHERHAPFRKLDAWGKIGRVFSLYVYIIAIYICYHQMSNDTGTVLGHIIFGEWPKELSVYSVMGNIFIIFVLYTLSKAIRKLLWLASRAGGQAGKTIARLLSSVVQYVTVIFGIYLICINFGVDAKTTIASAGIVGLGISFGAQDMIKDIIAGIFIFFEGNYKVGDMLMINGEWCWVKSIGIRSTKVEFFGSMRIINNSQMAGVVNIQNYEEKVRLDVIVGKENDLNEIAAIMERELPLVKEKYPSFVKGIGYQGVSGIQSNGYSLRFAAYCPSIVKGKVKRMVYGDLAEILKRYDISVVAQPYEIYSDKDAPDESIAEKALHESAPENPGANVTS